MQVQEASQEKPQIENERNAKIEQDKTQLVVHKQVDDVETADQKSRIMIGIEVKKSQKETQINEAIIENKAASEEIKMFTKLPSYFLQVQEQSFIIQQSNLSSPQTPPKTKSQLFGQKIKQKFESSDNIRKARQHKLTFSCHIFAPCDQKTKWQQQNAFIWDQFLCLGKIKIPVAQITKVKCLLEDVGYSQKKIKILKNHSQVYYLGASTQKYNNKQQQILCEHFLWFSQIICNKLYLMKSSLKHSKYDQIRQLQGIETIEAICKGTIYKKSQHLHQWQPRYVVITQKQLFSYIDSQKCYSFSIKSENIKYIWTRFDIINNHLIIKVKHGVSKTEFGIPITDYLQNSANNWLYGFYRLMMYNKGKFNP